MVTKGLDKFKNMCYNHNTKLKQERTKKKMGIKYYHLKERNEVIAVLENTRCDAISKIAKVLDCTKSLGFDPTKYLMPSSFRAVAKCHPADEWDSKIGENVAKKKLMRKYYKAYDRQLDAFIKDLNAATLAVIQKF